MVFWDIPNSPRRADQDAVKQDADTRAASLRSQFQYCQMLRIPFIIRSKIIGKASLTACCEENYNLSDDPEALDVWLVAPPSTSLSPCRGGHSGGGLCSYFHRHKETMNRIVSRFWITIERDVFSMQSRSIFWVFDTTLIDT